MAQNRLKRDNTRYELVNNNREEEHFELVLKTTDDLGLSTKYVDSLVKIERFYIKVIKTLLVTAFLVFPLCLLLYSAYQSFNTCNGLFGDSVAVFLKHHKNYKKFVFSYEKYYEPKSEVDFYKYPWMVRIIYVYKNKSYFGCSGFLITDRDIATAAHCLVFESGEKMKTEIHLSGTIQNDFSDSKVFSNDQFRILLHPKFDYYKQQHDIALMKLNKPLNFSKTIYPIRLPFERSLIPESLTLTGWIDKQNNTNKPMLKEKVIPIFSPDDCSRRSNRTFVDRKKIVVANFQKKSISKKFCGGNDGKFIFFNSFRDYQIL
ncbi:hypothetical protein ACKWTF_010164 [Chironomus riparius]